MLTNRRDLIVLLQIVCRKFFSASLPDIHSFRVNVLVSMAVALMYDAALILTSLRHTLSGRTHVKTVDSALGNTALHPIYPVFSTWWLLLSENNGQPHRIDRTSMLEHRKISPTKNPGVPPITRIRVNPHIRLPAIEI